MVQRLVSAGAYSTSSIVYQPSASVTLTLVNGKAILRRHEKGYVCDVWREGNNSPEPRESCLYKHVYQVFTNLFIMRSLMAELVLLSVEVSARQC